MFINWLLIEYHNKLQVNNTNANINTNVTVNDDTIVSQEQITTFHDSSATSVAISYPQQSEGLIPFNPYQTQTITEWLQRPYAVRTVSWSNQTRGTTIASVQLPRDYSAIPPIWEKMNRFAFIRGGFKISVRVNGTKFHYGKLILAWCPIASATGVTLNSLSAYPHVIISPTANEIVELDIPYVHFLQTLEVGSTNRAQQLGSLVLVVLNPLGGLSASKVEVTIFASMVNPQVSGYTPIDAGIPTQSTREPNMTFVNLARFTAQSGEADLKASKGMLSSSLEIASRFVSKIPSFNLGLVSDTLALSSRIAKYYGYCKPPLMTTTANMQLRTQQMSHTHGVENAATLTMKPDALLTLLDDHIGMSQTSMNALSYASRPGLVSIQSWESTQAPGFVITSLAVHPLVVPRDGAAGSTSVMHPTPLSYLAATCTFWRGTINYKIQLTASSFHSGRIRIGWYPGPMTIGANTTPDYEFASCVSKVVDLATESEVCISIPYLQSSIWQTTQREVGSINGTLFISVLNTLTSSEFPVPPVEINIWASAGPDFQLSYPNPRNIRRRPLPTFTAQSGAIEKDEVKYEPLIPAKVFVDEGLCCPETVRSLYDLIRRPMELLDRGVRSDEVLSLVIPPVYTPAPNNTTDSYTFMAHFAKSFLGFRGGTTLKLIASRPIRGTIVNTIGPKPWTTVVTGSGGIYPHSMGAGSTVVNDSTLQPLEATIPYVSQLLFLTPMDLGYASNSAYVAVGPIGESQSDVTYYQSAAEDFQYVFQLGPPSYRFEFNDLFLPLPPF